jgi:deazaflavin-dependent oxidoreductase (nitroreductase family)
VPIPQRVGRWNRAGLNRLTTPVLRRLPGFAVVHHVGRRSGRAYRTPVNLFPAPGGYLVALTYGPRTDWVRNVLAAGGCDIETRGRRVACTSPRLVHDPSHAGIRLPERPLLGLLRVDDFLALSVAGAPAPEPG